MLSDAGIVEAIERGDISISDFDLNRVETNSYDVILGGYFFEVIWGEDGPWYVGPVIADVGERINIPVGGTLLAMTKDRIGMFNNITAMMKSRSTTGREALTVCKCAGLGDVGYDNHWTMELSAFTRIGQPFVNVGQKIAQIAFFQTKSAPTRPYQGQYRIEDWPLCMIPKKWRHRIIADVVDMPGLPGLQTCYVDGKVTFE